MDLVWFVEIFLNIKNRYTVINVYFVEYEERLDEKNYSYNVNNGFPVDNGLWNK